MIVAAHAQCLALYYCHHFLQLLPLLLVPPPLHWSHLCQLGVWER